MAGRLRGHSAYRLDRVTRDEDWRSYHAIRLVALWDERGHAGYDDRYPDEYLPGNHPLLLTFEGRAIGTTRLDERGDGTGAVRLVAVASDFRGRGHGRVLGAMVEDYARSLGIRTLLVNAVPGAEGFYASTGWSRFAWDPAELTGLAADCVQMHKSIGEA